MLRLLVGELSLCDYRELLRSELGNFSASLAAADVNADFKVGRVEGAGNSWELGAADVEFPRDLPFSWLISIISWNL